MSEKIRNLQQYGRGLLMEWGLDSSVAGLEADMLLCHITGFDRIHMMINPDDEVTEEISERYIKLLNKRITGMPMAYIVGHREFMGMDFLCEQGVLIPRPDTEITVETVLTELNQMENDEILELGEEYSIHGLEIGVGTGIISLSLLANISNLKMLAGDINPIAIELAKKNSVYVDSQIELDEEKVLYQTQDRFRVIESDVFQNIPEAGGLAFGDEDFVWGYDFIVSNPPYIKTEEIQNLMTDVKDFEPREALDGTFDGLYFYRIIVDSGYEKIRHGGFVAFEIGHDQGMEVFNLMEARGYKNIRVIPDLAGHDRCVIGYKL